MRTPRGRKWYVRFFQDYVLALPNGVVDGMRRFTPPVATAAPITSSPRNAPPRLWRPFSRCVDSPTPES